MEDSNNWLKGLVRSTDYSLTKGAESAAATKVQPMQTPWSTNVISNLESGIGSEEHLMALIATYSGLGSMERGKSKA